MRGERAACTRRDMRARSAYRRARCRQALPARKSQDIHRARRGAPAAVSSARVQNVNFVVADRRHRTPRRGVSSRLGGAMERPHQLILLDRAGTPFDPRISHVLVRLLPRLRRQFPQLIDEVTVTEVLERAGTRLVSVSSSSRRRGSWMWPFLGEQGSQFPISRTPTSLRSFCLARENSVSTNREASTLS